MFRPDIVSRKKRIDKLREDEILTKKPEVMI